MPPNMNEIRRSLPISLLRTREMIMDDLRPILNRYDITEQQWRVLRVIEEASEPVYAKTIAERACLLAPSLTRILRTLDERGFLDFHPDGKDRRRFKVSLNQKAMDFINEVSPHTLKSLKNLQNIVGLERWDALIEVLNQIQDDITQARKSEND